MKCLTVLYLHYNEAMQNLCFFFIVCKYSNFPGAVMSSCPDMQFVAEIFHLKMEEQHWFDLFFAECRIPATVQGTVRVKRHIRIY